MGQAGPRRKLFRESLRAVGLVSGLGLELGLTTVGGALLGHYLDERWGTGPWLTLAGMFCGLGAGLSGVVAIIRRVGED